MSYGLSVQSALGTIQVDEQFINVRLIQSGTLTPVSDNVVQISLSQNFASPPLVLIRPSAFGRYIGAKFYTGPTPGFATVDSIQFLGRNRQSFEYAIFAIEGTAVTDNSTYGLNVWNSSGAVAFTSAHTRARITHMFNLTTFPECVSTPASYSLSGYSTMPWIVANTLYAYVSSGEKSYVYKGFVVGFDSYSTMRVSYGSYDSSFWPRIGCGGSQAARAPYPFQICVAKINEGA